MDKLRIAFVGIGSIARRHICNVCDFLDARGQSYIIDVYRSGIGKPLTQEIEKRISRQFVFSDESEIKEIYDIVFITNPTALHYNTLIKFQNNSRAFFIEKPVFSNFNIDLKALSKINDKICYVACPLRYNPVISYIKTNIDCKKVISVRAICSSYLPDWRPEVDYRKCYSAHTSMGGGVEIDLIHEWDYLTYLFGNIEKGYSIIGKFSDLEIDSNDVAIYIAKTKNTTIELHLDYFGRYNVRKIQLIMTDDTVDCDILNGRISYLKSGTEINFDKERNYYQMREIEHFFNIINNKIENDSTIEQALQVLRYAKGEF